MRGFSHQIEGRIEQGNSIVDPTPVLQERYHFRTGNVHEE